MKNSALIGVIVIAAALFASCGSTTGGGGGCSADADCSNYCDFDGATWAAGAPGAATNGGFCAGGSCYCCYALGTIDPATGAVTNNSCLACDEVGTNCDADVNYACYANEDVCLFNY